ncbi:unnamed protein product [Rotaria socialis]|nr:unnamed protein product [Rotaria socialis]CAF4711063.1 unnamed protein product [Rotaria socialis]
MSESNKKTPVIIDLNKILNFEDSTEIKRMETEFELNGWCFVFLPAELIPDSNLTKELSDFFQLDKRKGKYSQRLGIYGYSKVNHKEGLVPATLVKPLNYLSQVFDAVTKRLIEVLDQHSVFQREPSLPSLIELASLPWQEEYFGILDIVSYFNAKSGFRPPQNGQTTEEVNCIPHYDPGLLSINGPLEPNIGVIWLGEAASRITQSRLKPGIHRVVYPQESKLRLTLWYQLCTIEQLKNVSADKKDELMANGTVAFKNLPGSAPITVSPGETKLGF